MYTTIENWFDGILQRELWNWLPPDAKKCSPETEVLSSYTTLTSHESLLHPLSVLLQRITYLPACLLCKGCVKGFFRVYYCKGVEGDSPIFQMPFNTRGTCLMLWSFQADIIFFDIMDNWKRNIRIWSITGKREEWVDPHAKIHETNTWMYATQTQCG